MYSTEYMGVGGVNAQNYCCRSAVSSSEDVISISICFLKKIVCDSAFDTPTKMPYGSINLRHGVPPGETTITCAAGVGTFVVEFGVLSRLTGEL